MRQDQPHDADFFRYVRVREKPQSRIGLKRGAKLDLRLAHIPVQVDFGVFQRPSPGERPAIQVINWAQGINFHRQSRLVVGYANLGVLGVDQHRRTQSARPKQPLIVRSVADKRPAEPRLHTVISHPGCARNDLRGGTPLGIKTHFALQTDQRVGFERATFVDVAQIGRVLVRHRVTCGSEPGQRKVGCQRNRARERRQHYKRQHACGLPGLGRLDSQLCLSVVLVLRRTFHPDYMPRTRNCAQRQSFTIPR